MDLKKAPLSGTAALIVGTVCGLATAASAFIPQPWGGLVTILGFIGCVLAGSAATPPMITAGKPVLQGTFLAIAGSLEGVLHQFYSLIPAGWPQSLALGVAALLAWLTGHALPALGSPSPAALVVAQEAGAAAVAQVAGLSKAEVVTALENAPPLTAKDPVKVGPPAP